MATPENQQQQQDAEEAHVASEPIEQSLDGTQPEHEQQYKMLAVRVEEEVHAQLRFIAQLSGTSISAEIRTAIQQRIATAQEDPYFIERAHAAQAEIQREAAARTAAIAGFIGAPAVSESTTPAAPSSRRAAPARQRAADKKNETK